MDTVALTFIKRRRERLQSQRSRSMVTDVPFWTRQFGLLAESNYQHVRGIQKVVQHQTKYLESLKEKGCHGKDEKRFCAQIKSLNVILKDQLGKLETDASQYKDIETTLIGFEDKMDTTVCKLEQKYKHALDKLNEQTKVVETNKKLYHKLSFTTEKTEIKARMANQADVIYEINKKVDELKTKVSAQIDKYNKHLDKWDIKIQRVQKMAEDFEQAYSDREEARAKLVLTGLQNSVDLTMAGNYAKREAAFTHINEQRFVKDTIIQRETIEALQFQLYTTESYTDTAMTARDEVQTKHDVKSFKRDVKTTKDDNDIKVSETCTNPPKDKSDGFVVIKSYERQEINQLNLKAGEHVTQLLPANGAGLAYGQVVHGILHKKKKGFYPISHVIQLQIEAAETMLKVSPTRGNPEVDEITDTSKQVRKVTVKSEENDGEKKIESDARRRRREGKRKSKVSVADSET